MTVAARLLRTLALALLAWQAVVAQAHGHLGAVGGAAVVSTLAAHSTAPDRPDSPYDCPVCREVAHAGQYLSPGPILFAPPVAATFTVAALTLPIQPRAPPSHAWRSRAPPVPLPA